MAVEHALTEQERNAPCSFLDGYFAQQFAAGEVPDYGYPKNHLPETDDLEAMEVVTGFMAASK